MDFGFWREALDAITFLPVTTSADTTSQIGIERFPRTAAVLSEWIASGHQIGAQVFISRDFSTLADFAVGESRPGVPMTPGTIMLWLSASKPFAAVALAQLREQGLLDFGDPITRFIPEFAAHGKGAISLAHILTHTAGLRFVETGWPHATWDQIIATLCDAPTEANWPIGEKAGYSPFASWFVLAEVVRRLSGRAYADYLRDEIFLPLGMTDSWLALPQRRYSEYGDRIGLMMNTSKKPPEPAGDDTELAASQSRPSGGGRGPARELGRFYEMLLVNGRILPPPIPQGRAREGADADGANEHPESEILSSKSEILNLKSEISALNSPPAPSLTLPWNTGGRNQSFILSAESVALLTRPHRVGLFDHTFRHVMDWGLGFNVNSAKYGVDTGPYGFGKVSGARTFGHGGAQSTCTFADPDRNLALAIIFNGQPGEPAHQRRLRATLAAVEEDLSSFTPK